MCVLIYRKPNIYLKVSLYYLNRKNEAVLKAAELLCRVIFMSLQKIWIFIQKNRNIL